MAGSEAAGAASGLLRAPDPLKLLDEMVKFIGDTPVWIIIGHGDAEAEAREMEKMIMERVKNKRILYIKQITATMAVNTGPGLIGVLAFKNP